MSLAFTPEGAFHSQHYLAHNQKRQEHLASLNLPLDNLSVLEVGAGIGDHTHFFLKRNCNVLVTEARDENIAVLRRLHANTNVRIMKLDLENIPEFNEKFDIVYAYGTLYHLKNPEETLAFFNKTCNKILLLETCVSFGDNLAVNICNESVGDPTQSFSGYGCRPTRPWIHAELKKYFPYVYMPTTQPNHPEFPINWNLNTAPANGLVRSVFVASRDSIENALLTTEIPMIQTRIA
jgi:cyclopropane fatty-acyl-phospholipid synthase-like methyltransferase